jgi:hypothetical protein
MCVVFARTANGPDPLVDRLAAEVVAPRQPTTPHPGPVPLLPGSDLAVAGIFLLLTAGLAVLMLTEPAGVPDALNRRARHRRNRRFCTVVPLGAAHA